ATRLAPKSLLQRRRRSQRHAGLVINDLSVNMLSAAKNRQPRAGGLQAISNAKLPSLLLCSDDFLSFHGYLINYQMPYRPCVSLVHPHNEFPYPCKVQADEPHGHWPRTGQRRAYQRFELSRECYLAVRREHLPVP